MADPRNKIAQGAFEVDTCPVEDCTYVIRSSAAWEIHMWNVHKEDVKDRSGD